MHHHAEPPSSHGPNAIHPPGDPAEAPSTATRILLLRHAETSAPDRFHGAESDVDLSPRGHEQAEAAGRLLSPLCPDALYCSGMRRARETAEAIGRVCGLEPRVIPELHERIMGPLSGTPRIEAHPIYDDTRRRWQEGDLDATHPGGESFTEIRDRVVPAFRAIAERHRGGTVVVIAHGVVIRVLIATLVEGRSPADFEEISIAHVGIHDLSHDGHSWREARSGP